MDYAGFTDWMFRLERFGIKLGLENITELLSRIGDPHKELRSVHVTGTNGKGSVCAFVQQMLMAHGLRVGLYTSPHLVDFRERIKVGNDEISEQDVLRIGLELKKVAEAMASEDNEKQLTFFEFTTGLAFEYFRERKIDILVAEVGMGGRLDATNVLKPDVSVITRIGLEHTAYLGTTIQDIAREKAGIIKPGVPVVTCERNADALAVIAAACKKKGCRLIRIGEDFEVANIRQTLNGTEFEYQGLKNLKLRTRLLGGYQADNAAAALATIETLHDWGVHVDAEEERKGIMETQWPGRLEIVSREPLVILDGSHNPDGVSTTVRVLVDLGVTPLTFVLGCMDDKDTMGIVRAIEPVSSKIICTQSSYKRALSAKALAQIVGQGYDGPVEIEGRSEDAFEAGLESRLGKGVCIIGSLYLVGEAIPWWNKRERVEPPPHKL
jgi:dihydrofolate synthase/folylpolyglutamate synthase